MSFWANGLSWQVMGCLYYKFCCSELKGSTAIAVKILASHFIEGRDWQVSQVVILPLLFASITILTDMSSCLEIKTCVPFYCQIVVFFSFFIFLINLCSTFWIYCIYLTLKIVVCILESELCRHLLLLKFY